MLAAAQHRLRARRRSSAAQKRQQAAAARQQAAVARQQPASAGSHTRSSAATAGTVVPQGSGSQQQQQQQQLSQHWRDQQQREQWQQADSRGSLGSDWQQEVRRRLLAWPSRRQRPPRQRRHLQQAAQLTSSAPAAQPARQRTVGGSRWRAADEVGHLSRRASRRIAPFCRLTAAMSSFTHFIETASLKQLDVAAAFAAQRGDAHCNTANAVQGAACRPHQQPVAGQQSALSVHIPDPAVNVH